VEGEAGAAGLGKAGRELVRRARSWPEAEERAWGAGRMEQTALSC